MTEIVVLADTHVRSLQELPQKLRQYIQKADWVFHCGDFTSSEVVAELRSLARHFIGVYGNTDPDDIRNQLPAETTIEIEGKQIAITHPYWGGPPDGLEEELLTRFPNVDAILFGHTHDPCNLRVNGTLLLNPGQGYPFFITPARIGILTVSRQDFQGQIITL